MLIKFEVENFKNFKNKIVLDLSKTKGYEFNDNLVEEGVIRGGVIFGKNASGKSNLGLAIFDIVNHLTDKEKTIIDVHPYVNLDTNDQVVHFKYVFKFDNSILEYNYGKTDPEVMVYEEIKINDKIIINYDHFNSTGDCQLKGTENLNKKLDGNRLSFVKYINNNSVLIDNEENKTFKKFINFVDNMLLFYSLEYNRYYGYKVGGESIADSIVKKGCLNDFERFLNKLDINYKLKSREIDGKNTIYVKYDNGEANFYSVASTGTKALALFYYWTINSDEVSFIFMDEFDAYYHFELSEEIVKHVLNTKNIQIIFTSHNTNLMDNDLFRPDCLFIMQNSGIRSMCNLTKKELRQAHNLQKMYKAGAFDE